MDNVKIIAEIGSVHDGSFGNAKCLIKAAAKCGVDAVKFQTHIAEAETLKDAPSPDYFFDESRWDYFKRTSFSLKQYQQLKAFSEKECGVEFISSPFSIEAVALLERVGVSTYKVPSGEITNLPMLIELSKTGKSVILSSGMSTWNELNIAVECLRENNCKDFSILQCTSEYPCPTEHAGINVIQEIRKRFGVTPGFSDHTEGIALSILAVAVGAEIIEKHFTLSKGMYGSDAKNATEPSEFRQLVEAVRIVEKAKVHSVDKDKAAENLGQMKCLFEKSIIINQSLSAGTILQSGHLSYKKPGDGISARHFMDVIGTKLRENVEQDTKFSWDMVSGKS